MSEPAQPPLSGTPQFPGASDLSQYAVHMTATEENLVSILMSGCIEARKPHGFTYTLGMVHGQHLSSSYSEMPLKEIHRLNRHGSYGIAFPQDWLRAQGAQRVWYLDEGSISLTALNEIKNGLVQTSQWDHPFWKITPYVDLVASRHSWTHERELRHVGDLHFDLADVALLIAPSGTDFSFTSPSLGTPVLDPSTRTYTWTGGAVPAIGAAMMALLDQFHEEFVQPDEVPEWVNYVEGIDTVNAVGELFENLPEHVQQTIVDHLNQEYGDYWINYSEIAAYEDAEADAQVEQWKEERYYERHHPDREP